MIYTTRGVTELVGGGGVIVLYDIPTTRSVS